MFNNPKNILLTSDLSPESTKAYPYARSLAELYNASLSLVTFIDTSIQFSASGSFDLPVVYLPETIAQIKERASADLQEHCKQHLAGVSISTEVVESSDPVQYGIVSYIKEKNIDLVIMASHGRSGLTRTLLGSVAEQVLRRSDKPVLVVPVRG